MVNHDLYRRACEADGAELVVLLGEGTFHQIHGGAATSGRFGWDEMHADYVALRSRDYVPPEPDALYLGRLPLAALGQLEVSVRLARERGERLGRRLPPPLT